MERHWGARVTVTALAAAALAAGFGVVDANAEVKRFRPVADAHVSQAKRKANFGASKRLVVDGSPVVRSYLRFNVRGLGGAVSYATLQLSMMRASGGIVVRRARANHWDESKIRFTNAPSAAGTSIRVRGVRAFRTSSIDVTRLVRGSGVVTFVLSATGRGGGAFASGEALSVLRPVLVVGVNEAPVCRDMILLTSEDTPGTEDPAKYCTDTERDRLSYRIVSQGTQGTASVVGGKLRYVPRANANGVDRFKYRAKDGRKFSKTMTVTVSIRGINDPPTCAPRTLFVDEDGGGAIGHLCDDVDGDSLIVSITSGAQRGTSTVVGGELRYTPSPNTNGTDTFTYRARDTTLASAPATVTVHVRPVNDAPTCTDVTLATSEDIAAERDPACTDIDGDALSYGISAQGAKGTASAGGGRLRYDPNANTNGPDSFAYHAFDGAAASPPAAASVSVAPVNDPPICQPISFETPEDQAREVNPSCVDLEGDAMTYFVSAPARGSTSISPGKLLRYVPNANVTGPDAFSYWASDGAAVGAPAPASVMVGPVNDPPVCTARTITLDEDDVGATAPACSDPEGDTLTYAISTQGTKGVASIAGGNLHYDANPNANGADTFTYRANDGGLTSAAVAVSVTIRPVNDAPVCANVTLLTNEDVIGERSPSCSDVDNDPLTYAIAAQGTRGTASVASGRLRYAPDANQNGADSFTYRASDGVLPSAAATVAVTIAAINDAPTCSAVSVTTNEDVAGERDPACADVDGNPLTYSIVTGAGKGAASVTTAGRLRFVPNANANGSDSFTYRATDGSAQSGAATVSVSIAPVNDAPACANVSLAGAEDEASEAVPSCTDVDGEALVLSVVSQPAKGTASVVSGKLRYHPDLNTNGNDSFRFRAFDGTAFSPDATASVSVTAVNDAPVCNPVSITVDEDGESTVPASCSDVEGDALTYSIATQGAKGTASVVGSSLRYVANPNAGGLDQFTYRARDASATGAAAQATVSIGAVNDPPTCSARTLTVNEDATFGTVAPLCTDPENDQLTYSIAEQGTKGTASVVGGELRYTPDANANGTDTFKYIGSDAALASAPATVTVTIQAVNDAPTCVSVVLATNEDTTGEETPACTDLDGDTLIYSIVAPPAHGTASVVAAKLRYAPAANFNGSDGFTYRAHDGTAFSAPASVAASVAAVNDAPTCSGVTLATDEDVAGEREPSCADVDGDALTYAIAGPATKGTASVAGGKLRYAPHLNANGPDSFTYRASDGTSQSPAATVSVSIAAVNDAPTCANVALTTDEDVAGERDPSCTDVDGDGVTYAIVGAAAKGTASIAAGRLRYVPNANANGADSFTYRASDGSLNSSAAAASVTINAVNDAPTCEAVALATDEDVMGERDPSCADVDGDALTYSIAGTATKGTASVVANKLRYVPNSNANGADSFTYRASDGLLQSAPATVATTIASVNDAPACTDVSLSTNEDTAVERDPSCTDVDGDALTYAIAAQGAKGTASVNGAKLRYAPAANLNGGDSFAYRATDGNLTSAAASVAVTIAPVNDAPTCSGVSLVTAEDTAAERDPVCSDVEGQALTFSIAGQGAIGTASVVAGRLRYAPNANRNGADTFTYQASDGTATGPAAVADVTISAVNDAPTCGGVAMTVTEDVPAERDPACSDVDGDALTYSVVAQGSKGLASIAGGKLRYEPQPNATGTDSFTYNAADGAATSGPATVSVTINQANDPPVCENVSLTTDEDVAGQTDPACTDVDGGTLSYSIVTSGLKGSASVSAGKLRFSPSANANGGDSFTYRASDGSLSSAPATVTVTIGAVNDAPVCGDVTLATDEDTTGEREPSCADVDGDVLSYSIAGQATKGGASVVAGKLRYTPNANTFGADSFGYRAFDSQLTSAPATVSVTVASVNDAPVCENLSVVTGEDVTVERDPVCSDVEGNPFTYAIAGQATKGTASISAGRLRYAPNANANGADSFTYVASDGSTGAPATVSVSITAINDAPVCPAQSLTIAEDTDGTMTPACTDIEGNPITLEIVTQANDGTAAVFGNSIRYVPFADANGPDSFTYRGRDASAGAPVTVSINVTPVNDEPEAIPVDVGTGKGVAKVITLSGFDYDDDPLTFRITSLPANGGLRAGPNASDHLITSSELPYSLIGTQVRYEPNAGFTGTNSFQFRAHDGTTAGLPADVRVSVVGANVAPTCSGRTLNVDEDATLTGSVCSDADGDALTFTRTGPTRGQVTMFQDGSFEYAPEQNYHGPDSFTVVARDPSGAASSLATVSITVASVNDAPTCRPFTLTTTEDTAGLRFADCEDVDEQALTYAIVGQGTKGTASVDPDGRLRYVPNANENGADSFAFTVSDGSVTSGPHTADVSIAAVNDAPTCSPVALTTRLGTPGTTPPDCGDVDGNPLTYTIVAQPANGTASVVGGELRYDPNFAFFGEDSFTYQASDGSLSSAAETVSVTVTPL